jgi:hypothetical protein
MLKIAYFILAFIITSPLFAGGIEDIVCGEDYLEIDCLAQKPYYLVELQIYEQYKPNGEYKILHKGNYPQEIKIERFNCGKDRLYSKFALVDSKTDKLIGGYKYVSSVNFHKNGDFKLPRPKSIKGLSCIVDIQDAVELGVKYVHENVYISELIDIDNDKPDFYYEFDGFRMPLVSSAVKGLDTRMKRFTDAGIAVFVVLINQMPKDPQKRTPLVHPNSDIADSPTRLGAFNITNETGLKYYLGITEFLAARYTRADKKYGLMSSLIVGNEVQQHWVWHNVGDMPEDEFIREYEQSVRLAYLASTKFHSDIKIYISMDHHWNLRGFNNNPLREIPGNLLLEKLAANAKAGGDYPWNLAIHPYPENLFEPRFWLDKSPTDKYDTPRITFKNMESLPGFMRREQFLYDGEIRDIAFTEQGFHSPSGEDGEKLQAAAYAYAYYKMTQMPEISAFILHRHVDHRQEGGLRLGLWTAKTEDQAKDPCIPERKKYIWNVFKHADTDNWQRAFEFAKPILGIEEWGQTPSDKNPDVKSIFDVDDDALVYDFIKEFDSSTNHNNLDCRPKDAYRAAGWLVPAIFQHPPHEGKGVLRYNVELPQPDDGKKLALIFETMLGTDDGDGVNYSIMINNQTLWSALHNSVEPKSYSVDITAYAGKTVSIRFIVDKNVSSENDWSYWVSPMLVIK